VEAAEQLRAFSRHSLCEVHVWQVQLDELSSMLSDVKAGELSEDETMKRLDRSPTWVWTAMDPESTWLLGIDVGPRTPTMAQWVVHQVAQILAPSCTPLFLTDGYKDYRTTLLTHVGHWGQSPRHHATGPAPKLRWKPRPELCSAQVIKTPRRRCG